MENKSEKILICHHLEPMWSESLLRYKVNPDEFAQDVITHIKENNYDRIILTRFEDDRWSTYTSDDYYTWEELKNILQFGNHKIDVEIYDYGWCVDMFLGDIDFPDETETVVFPQNLRDGSIIVEGGIHSEVVLVPDWIQNLQDCEISICGMFDNECIEDLEIALKSQAISFNRIEDLIVG